VARRAAPGGIHAQAPKACHRTESDRRGPDKGRPLATECSKHAKTPPERGFQGEALLYDPAVILAIVRKDADIALDPLYSFDTGEVGLRVYLRATIVVGQGNGAVHITFAT